MAENTNQFPDFAVNFSEFKISGKPLCEVLRYFVIFLVLATGGIGCSRGISDSPKMLELSGNLGVHDPAVIKESDTYYLFSTGGRPGRGFVPVRCSNDLRNWEFCGYVFDNIPDWAKEEIPGTKGIWAPDISRYNGKYHLYYSISTFGKNNSAIGLAVNKTLDPSSPDYEWVDKGMVVRSKRGEDDWNAIDANLVIEDKNNVWLCWGSFWSGIKMRRVNPETGKLSEKDTTLYSLGSRPREGEPQIPPVEGAVEAPYIISHNGYWYLFVSFDLCCRGTESTYKVVVGRSEKVTGPYYDKEGKSMTEGGGTIILKATTENWRGPGHPAVLRDETGDYLFCHAYHGETGRPRLKISTIKWENGWPVVAELP